MQSRRNPGASQSCAPAVGHRATVLQARASGRAEACAPTPNDAFGWVRVSQLKAVVTRTSFNRSERER
jgi:hypothetical protein